MNVMKARAASPDVLVDLNRLEELRRIARSADGGLELGAMATYTQLMLDPPWRSRGRSSPRWRPRSRTSRCGTAARSAATSARTTRRTTFRRSWRRSTRRMTIRGADGERDGRGGGLLPRRLPDRGRPRRAADDDHAAAAGGRDGFAAVTLGRDGTCIVNAAANLDGEPRIAIGCVDAVPGRSSAPEGTRRGERAGGRARGFARPAGGRPRVGRLPPPPRRGARRPRRPASA